MTLVLPGFGAVNDNHLGSELPPIDRKTFCVAWDGYRWEVGIVPGDGGVRVDYHGPLDVLTFWKAEWIDPTNPWKGYAKIIGPWPTTLIPRYS